MAQGGSGGVMHGQSWGKNLRCPVAGILDRQARLLASGELLLDQRLCPDAVAAPAAAVDDAGVDYEEVGGLVLGCQSGDGIGDRPGRV